jgi:hypothetical protein
MIEYKSPSVFGHPSLFMAGGITGVPDWQSELLTILERMQCKLSLVNPRRSHFDVKNKAQALEQIRWEYLMLRRCDGVMFWFAAETVQPIVLFELGAHLMVAGKPLFIGIHPDYPRRVDVEVQTSLIRPDLEIVYNLEALAGQVVAWERRGIPTWLCER